MTKDQLRNLSDMQLEWHINRIRKAMVEAVAKGKSTDELYEELKPFLMEDYNRKNAG